MEKTRGAGLEAEVEEKGKEGKEGGKKTYPRYGRDQSRTIEPNTEPKAEPEYQ